MAAPKFKAGDEVVFCHHKRNKGIQDVTIGKVYTVYKDLEGVYFLDDAQDVRRYAIEDNKVYKPTKIVG
jgi:hypothetical protein